MKKQLFLLSFFSFSLAAAEVKIAEINTRDLFGYEKINTDFIFDKHTELAGVEINLFAGHLSEHLPRTYEFLVDGLTFDKAASEITMLSNDKRVVCAKVRKNSVMTTGNCKIEDRDRNETTVVGLRRVTNTIKEFFIIF